MSICPPHFSHTPCLLSNSARALPLSFVEHNNNNPSRGMALICGFSAFCCLRKINKWRIIIKRFFLPSSSVARCRLTQISPEWTSGGGGEREWDLCFVTSPLLSQGSLQAACSQATQALQFHTKTNQEEIKNLLFLSPEVITFTMLCLAELLFIANCPNLENIFLHSGSNALLSAQSSIVRRLHWVTLAINHYWLLVLPCCFIHFLSLINSLQISSRYVTPFRPNALSHPLQVWYYLSVAYVDCWCVLLYGSIFFRGIWSACFGTSQSQRRIIYPAVLSA